ncbi:hypothetical protein PQR46_28695 [Paraburkholderia sediminicola]|uniref:hypothetical protein n=1 Tax=Paraburkholderia TaxID=1822464 RepID=UPI0038BC839D
MMANLKDLFDPLIGTIAFSVKQTYGSFFLIEFGDPWLRIQEPIEPRPDDSEETRARLQRRRVFVTGTWSLLVADSNWTLACKQRVINQDVAVEDMAGPFRDIEGQYLSRVYCNEQDHSCVFEFDLGGLLTVWPTLDSDPNEDQWRLHYKDRSSMGYTNNGSFLFEPKKDPGKT